MKRFFSLLMVCVLVIGMTMSMAAPAMAAEASKPYYLFGRGTLGNVNVVIYSFSNSNSTVRVRIGNSEFTCPVTHVPLGAPGASMTQSVVHCDLDQADIEFYTGLDETVNTKNASVSFDISIIHETNAKVQTHYLKASGSYKWRTQGKVRAPKNVGENTFYSYQTVSRYELTVNTSGCDYTYYQNKPWLGVASKSDYSIRMKVSVYDSHSVVKHDRDTLRSILIDGKGYEYSVSTIAGRDPYFNNTSISAKGYTARLNCVDYVTI